MKKSLSASERLDLIAKTQFAGFPSRLGPAIAILAVLNIVLAVISTAPFWETLSVRILAVCLVLTGAFLSLDWRYKMYPLAATCSFAALVIFIFPTIQNYHTLFGWFAAHAYSLLISYWAIALWVFAGRYAVVNSKEWEHERDQVSGWAETLRHARDSQVATFDIGSFWVGYWTVRILRSGEHWVIGTFKRQSHKLQTCRVCGSDEVIIDQLPSGKWKINIQEQNSRLPKWISVPNNHAIVG